MERTIPEELLIEIFTYLEPKELFLLCLCGKQFNEFVKGTRIYKDYSGGKLIKESIIKCELKIKCEKNQYRFAEKTIAKNNIFLTKWATHPPILKEKNEDVQFEHEQIFKNACMFSNLEIVKWFYYKYNPQLSTDEEIPLFYALRGDKQDTALWIITTNYEEHKKHGKKLINYNCQKDKNILMAITHDMLPVLDLISKISPFTITEYMYREMLIENRFDQILWANDKALWHKQMNKFESAFKAVATEGYYDLFFWMYSQGGLEISNEIFKILVDENHVNIIKEIFNRKLLNNIDLNYADESDDVIEPDHFLINAMYFCYEELVYLLINTGVYNMKKHCTFGLEHACYNGHLPLAKYFFLNYKPDLTELKEEELEESEEFPDFLTWFETTIKQKK